MLVNQENDWTIEKWHIRAAFRRCGFWVPDHAIKMSDRTISGPNLDLEKKIFLVTVTVKYSTNEINLRNMNLKALGFQINNVETTPVRCIVRHWPTAPENRSPLPDDFLSPPYEPIFEDERQIISELPLPTFLLKKSIASR